MPAQLKVLCVFALLFWTFVGVVEGILCAPRKETWPLRGAKTLYSCFATLVLLVHAFLFILVFVAILKGGFRPPSDLFKFFLTLAEFFFFSLGLTLLPYPLSRRLAYLAYRRRLINSIHAKLETTQGPRC